ncbi:DUF4303 domain-containing protein [Nocardioides sp. ChNu-153]|uniref:DUF4303 domain-containing protein n=1 Tax=Nocardioides sp. ChNu-153 TaxID=2779364 RepID=UPI00264B22FE|nr:DUF4303 domain-containing protein [Nocardioides sp. ChNu-153]MDN7122103.1 DUF4303 domain-containing protein [Nocardioides sp. ChNu-153]
MDDLDALRDRLVTSIVATLGPLLAPYDGERVYAVALLTDSDVSTVGLAAHGEGALARLVAAQSAADRDDEGMRAHLRWWPTSGARATWAWSPRSARSPWCA